MSPRYVGDVFWFTNYWTSGITTAAALNGQTLPVADYQSLYGVLVAQEQIVYDDSAVTFAVPDLTGGAPSLFMPYMLSTGERPYNKSGVLYYPGTTGYFRVTDDPYVGEVDNWNGDFAPSGWAFCDGSVLPIAQNTTLFSIISNTYGGDAKKTFALPTISGSVICVSGSYPSRA